MTWRVYAIELEGVVKHIGCTGFELEDEKARLERNAFDHQDGRLFFRKCREVGRERWRDKVQLVELERTATYQQAAKLRNERVHEYGTLKDGWSAAYE